MRRHPETESGKAQALRMYRKLEHNVAPVSGATSFARYLCVGKILLGDLARASK